MAESVVLQSTVGSVVDQALTCLFVLARRTPGFLGHTDDVESHGKPLHVLLHSCLVVQVGIVWRLLQQRFFLTEHKKSIPASLRFSTDDLMTGPCHTVMDRTISFAACAQSAAGIATHDSTLL